MRWAEISWPRFAELDKQIPVIVPTASCEQHGHHLPVIVDTAQVTHIAEAAERILGNEVILTPTLWLGSSHHHLDFPGTLSVPASVFSTMVEHLARCILRAGFKRVLFLNGHGGNSTPIAQALTELCASDDVADDAFLVNSSWWTLGRSALASEKLGMQTAQLSHACEYETSTMLHIAPQLVDMSKANDQPRALDNAWSDTEGSSRGTVVVHQRFHRRTPTGSMGSPTHATAAKGAQMLAGVTAEVVRFIREFRQWQPLAKLGPQRP